MIYSGRQPRVVIFNPPDVNNPFVHSGTGPISWQVETRGKVHTVSLKPRLSVCLVAFFLQSCETKSGMESLGLRLPHSGKKLMCYLVCLSSMYKVSPSEGSCHQGMFRLHAIYYRRMSLGWQSVFSLGLFRVVCTTWLVPRNPFAQLAMMIFIVQSSLIST